MRSGAVSIAPSGGGCQATNIQVQFTNKERLEMMATLLCHSSTIPQQHCSSAEIMAQLQ